MDQPSIGVALLLRALLEDLPELLAAYLGGLPLLGMSLSPSKPSRLKRFTQALTVEWWT